jgi:hypothetical protein
MGPIPIGSERQRPPGAVRSLKHRVKAGQALLDSSWVGTAANVRAIGFSWIAHALAVLVCVSGAPRARLW